jgi:hypothetical protein
MSDPLAPSVVRMERQRRPGAAPGVSQRNSFV